jgi:hypothetical protein
MADLGTITCRTAVWPLRRSDLPLSSAQAGAVHGVSTLKKVFYHLVPFWASSGLPLAAGVSGTISGVVTDGGTPVSRCVVRLYYRATGAYVRSTFTDSSGAFSFTGLDTADTKAFFCIAFDPEGGTQYNAIIFDRLTAT